MSTELVQAGGEEMVGADTLKYLGLDPARPEVHALVLLCHRYRLDPLLGHASIIAAKGGNKAYITRDGMIEVAHRSGQLDGIVVDEQRESENGYSATVSVYRKDMGHPFTYKGGCGADEAQAKAGNGAEMALARAERRALRRAFSIPAYDDADEPNLAGETNHTVNGSTGEISPPAPGPEKGEPRGSRVIASPAPTTPTQTPARGRPTAAGTGPKPTTWNDGTPMFDEKGQPI